LADDGRRAVVAVGGLGKKRRFDFAGAAQTIRGRPVPSTRAACAAAAFAGVAQAKDVLGTRRPGARVLGRSLPTVQMNEEPSRLVLGPRRSLAGDRRLRPAPLVPRASLRGGAGEWCSWGFLLGQQR